jgi:cytochrome c5
MLTITVVAGLVLAPFCAVAENKLTLNSISVDLPNSDRMFPDGPGADTVDNNCLACHSAGMVLNQPAMSKAQWHAEVEKMRAAYRAPVDANDVAAIVDYLAALGDRR